jgi:uncharacterized lipoprotein YmbA
MEGSMDSEMNKQSYKLKLPKKLEFSNAADATGFWFAAIVLCAVLAAGVIVYRTGNSDMVTASNDTRPSTAQGNPAAPPPPLRQR